MVVKPVIDPLEYRRALGEFATGVTVVSTVAGGETFGATVNAFTSVSVDPRLILVSLDRRSATAARLPNRPFAVSILGRGQESAAWQFSGKPQPLAPEPEWEHPEPEYSVLRGSVAWFTCEPWAVYDGGDHVLVVGEVRECHRSYGDPLLFHGGAFCNVIGAPRDELSAMSY